MGWMEKGERRAREQVRDFVSGPSKGNKVLENGSGGSCLVGVVSVMQDWGGVSGDLLYNNVQVIDNIVLYT